MVPSRVLGKEDGILRGGACVDVKAAWRPGLTVCCSRSVQAAKYLPTAKGVYLGKSSMEEVGWIHTKCLLAVEVPASIDLEMMMPRSCRDDRERELGRAKTAGFVVAL